jgi:hypothetical protein
MATLTVQTVTRAGVDLAAAFVTPAAGGDEWANTGQEYLHVRNASGSPITVTLDIKNAPDGLAVTDKTVSVPATTGHQVIGPFPVGNYNDSTTGLAKATCSATASVTVAVVKCPAA